MPSNKVAWVEGSVEARDLIFRLADEIVNAQIPDDVNRWEKVYQSTDYIWVTYKENYRGDVQGYYKHTDGKLYPVYKLRDLTKGVNGKLPDSGGYLYEYNSPRKIQVVSFTYIDENQVERTLIVPGLLVVNVDDPNDPTGVGKTCYVVEQVRQELDGTYKYDPEWNEFRIVTKMPSDWNYFLNLSSLEIRVGNTIYDNAKVADLYKFRERYYIADPVHYFENTVILKATPSVPDGMTQRSYWVMFRQPYGQYNYFDVYYGDEIIGIEAVGDGKWTYEKVCDVSTVKPGQVPTIINQKEAEKVYKIFQEGTSEFKPPKLIFSKDITGKDIISPPSHYFYGANSVLPWLQDKKRRPDYLVRYWISVNNERIAMVIEGDPAPDMDGYYRSFCYIGRIIPFNQYDYLGNFAVTTGMGHLNKAKTDMELNDIKQDSNPVYSGWGRYTSNGMYSVSMLLTASKVFFQAHYPAFLTQLPEYDGIGTLPPELKSIVLDKFGFQASKWTGKYHASPIYLVHPSEGYRGYMDGVVAIVDHNLINGDELIVDTEELKDPDNPELGTWQEVYKFFSLNTPVSFLKYSPNPTDITIAILKEIR